MQGGKVPQPVQTTVQPRCRRGGSRNREMLMHRIHS
jgi:hypothetical protein